MSFFNSPYFAVFLGLLCSVFSCWFLPSIIKKHFTANRYEAELRGIPYNSNIQDVFAYVTTFLKKILGVKDIHILFNNDNECFKSVYTTSKTDIYPPVKVTLFCKYVSQRTPVLLANRLLEKNNKDVFDFLQIHKGSACMVIQHNGELLGLVIAGKIQRKKKQAQDFLSILTSMYSHLYVFMCYLKYIALQPLAGVSSNDVLFSAEVIQSVYNNVDTIENENAEAAIFMSSIKKLHGAYVDFIKLDKNRYIVVVGDFCKHGLSTCMSVVILKTMVRLFASQTDSLQELVSRTYQFFSNSLPDQEVFSGLFMLVDFEKHSLLYTCFGIETFFLYSEKSEEIVSPKLACSSFRSKYEVFEPEISEVSLKESTIIIASTGEFHPEVSVASVLKEDIPAYEILKKLYNAYVITDHVSNEDSCSVLIKVTNKE